jgi:hypothetical protein
MNLNEIDNWDEVSDDNLYQIIEENKDLWKSLAEEKIEDETALQAHPIWEVVRDRSIRSLYFLNLFLWDANPFGGPEAPISENLMTLENHKHVIDMFVKKDPTKSIAQQSKVKTRLILYPRGSLKSSWGIFDVIQWVLLDPKIRILVLSAADDLASAIVDEIRGFFTIKEAEPTLINLFWPEHCLLEKDLPASGEYSSPQWTKLQIKRREPTIMSRGVTSSVSGFHFEVFHGDDAVETRNAASEEQCISVRKKYGITRKVLRTFGYTNLLGTRYHDLDLYGDIIAKAELGEFTSQEFSIGEKKISNIGKGVEILIGAAMTIKPEAEMDLVKYNLPRASWFRKAGREGCVLLMPKVLSFDTLLVAYEEEPEAFETQMRQNVIPPTQQMFTRELILKNTVNWRDIPPYGRLTQTWDLNGGKGKKDNDFCVGTTCLWNSKGTGFIIDIVCTNYPTPVAIAQGLVQFACKYHPDVISIEDSLGIRMIEATIWAEADKTDDTYVKNLVRHIYWRKVDVSKDAKKNRISALYPLILYGRMKFEYGMKELERFIEQIIRPVTKSSKNDIPDCISYQMDFLPMIPPTEAERKKIEEELAARRRNYVDKASWEMIFTEGWQSSYRTLDINPQPEEFLIDEVFENPMPYVESDGLDNILGSGLIG